jgi:hypothetical protein
MGIGVDGKMMYKCAFCSEVYDEEPEEGICTVCYENVYPAPDERIN